MFYGWLVKTARRYSYGDTRMRDICGDRRVDVCYSLLGHDLFVFGVVILRLKL